MAEQPDRLRWTTTCGKAATPQRHALILAARRLVGNDHNYTALVAEYQRLRAAGAYAELDRLRLTAGQLADLAVVVNGGAAGVNAHRLDGNVRIRLATLQLTAALPGSMWGPADWRATVAATISGVAMIRDAQGRPVQLSKHEAVPLALVERAMRTTTDRGCPTWPGSALGLRIAQMWRLVEYVRAEAPPGEHWTGHLPAAVYRLTPAGRDALQRQRGVSASRDLTPEGAELLARVNVSARGDLGVLSAGAELALQACLEAGWLTAYRDIPGTSRQAVRLTESGRDALESWRFQAQAAAAGPVQSFPVTDIQPGQWVRASNRKNVKGVGPDWVRVVEVRHVVAHTGHQLAHNYEVWVRSDAHPEPFLYAGRSLYRTVRFHIKAL